MTQRLIGTDSSNPRLPVVVIDATIGTGAHDLAAGNHTHAGGGSGGTPEEIGAVASSDDGDGPQSKTMAVYSGNGFATLVTKDPNTFYVITPGAGSQGALYLGNTLVLGTPLTIPDQVPSVSATPGDASATVGWGTPYSGGLSITGYVVQRSLNDTTGFTTIATLSAATHTYNSTGLTNGTTYYFRVRATNALGNGTFSSVVSAKPVTGSAITLASDDLTADYGTPITFTAAITSGGSPIGALGNVTFKRGGNVMGGVAVDATGHAVFAISGIPVGTYTITADYDGGDTYLTSTSNPLTQVVQFPGGPAATTAVLSSDDASSTPGQAVTFSCAVVRTSTGAPVNSGSVLFKDGAVTISPSRPVDPATGIATFATSILTTATHTITATFNGAPFYAPCTSNAVTQIVAPGTGGSPISQAVWISKPLAPVNEIVSLRSTVRSGSSGVTTGQVEFFDGATSLGMGTPLNVYGESTFVLPTGFSVGTHPITAQYTDSTAAHENDTSSPVSQVTVATITAPFDYNTGHLTNGFTNADLWRPAGATATTRIDINAAWLTANAAAGKVVDDGGGHWTITGMQCNGVRLVVSHLTFNHCWIHRVDYASSLNFPGIHVWDTAGHTGTTDDNGVLLGDYEFNYCTLSTDGTGGTTAVVTSGDTIIFVPNAPVPDDMVFNNCEVTMWTACFKAWHGCTVNYCWVHDLNLFGFDPHNTSMSIRGRQNRAFRNLFCDGTSSCLSLYSDSIPHTEFWINENTMWVNPLHASQEVNFPLRGLIIGQTESESPLKPGYIREFVGNKFLDGTKNGDNQYWSKIAGNSQLGTKLPMYGGADPVQIAGVPTLLTLASTGMYFNALAEMATYHYTPTELSTQLCFMMIGRAATTLNPSLAINDESGAVWLPIEGCATPIALASGGGGAGPTIYAASCDIWQTQSGSGEQPFRRILIDPYTTSNAAYMAAMVVELTGINFMNLAQPPVMSNAGVAVPFGGTVASLNSGSFASNATPGNLVLCFVGFNHEAKGRITPPDGWNLMGSNYDIRTSCACLWRDDFAGKQLSIPAFPDQCSVALTVMIEVAT